MLVVGLTGNIGSGKSTVAHMLRQLGAKIIDTDQLARDVVAPGTDTLQQISQTFGPSVLNQDGTLNRAQTAQIVFADPVARERLNGIIHPAIFRVLQRQIAAHKKDPSTPLLVVEAPLLIETGLQQMVDQVWLVTVDEDSQIARAARRDNTDAEQIKKRLKAQMPQKDKIPYANLIIDNSQTLAQTQRQVQQIWQQINPAME